LTFLKTYRIKDPHVPHNVLSIMNKNCYSRLEVLRASLEFCKGHSFTERKGLTTWSLMAERIKVLVKANAEESKLMASFGSEIAQNLDKPKEILQSLDGEWLELLSKVLNAIVSPETKRERLNCATCDPVDFPLILAVIQVLAYAAPAQMWRPSPDVQYFVGVPSPEDLRDAERNDVLASHYLIAEKTWYRPELVMLVTSIWPNSLDLEYYSSTLQHIMEPEGPPPSAKYKNEYLDEPPETIGVQ